MFRSRIRFQVKRQVQKHDVIGYIGSLDLDPVIHSVQRDEARASLFDYIECFYNRKRRHGYLGNIARLTMKTCQSVFLKRSVEPEQDQIADTPPGCSS